MHSLLRYLIILSLAAVPPLSLSAKRSHPKYVTVRTDFELKNSYQLGNQFFCISTALAYAWDNHFIPVFPFLNESGGNRQYNRDHIFFRLKATNPKPIQTFYYDMSWSYKPIPIYKNDLCLVGPFNSWRYFDHHREQLKQLFAPSAEVETYLQNKYGDLLSQPNTVGVHVRTSDRKTHPHIPFPGLQYFEKAMEYFPHDSLFVVFSDRINWCKKKFPECFPNKTFIFIDDNHLHDLFLLSKMHNHIISNSTYSWWAAYLSPHTNHTVLVPDGWLGPSFNASVEDFYLPEWIRVPHDLFSEPYPEDMYWYDQKSKSLDN